MVSVTCVQGDCGQCTVCRVIVVSVTCVQGDCGQCHMCAG